MPPRSVDLLHAVAHDEWQGVHVARPIAQLRNLRLRTAAVRICGRVNIVVTAYPVDIAPKLEAFRVHVSLEPPAGEIDARFKPAVYEPAGEVLSAFSRGASKIMLGARRHEVPTWASSHVGRLLVEDLLVLQDQSGQRAFVVPDDDQPGTLIITRDKDELPVPDADLITLRLI